MIQSSLRPTDLPIDYSKVTIQFHLVDYANPHKVTKEQVGLGNTDNTSDVDKPVSDATKAALDIHTEGIATNVTAIALNTSKRTYPLVDETKLGLVEDEATADQTGAEIKVLYEAELKAFTDALFDKLDGIEDGATADLTQAEIKVLYELNLNTNVFDDAAQSKLSGIEAGATQDQSNSEIKIAYEANTNTNEFSDSEKAKLAALESSHFKGQYTNLQALIDAVPTPSIGDYGNVDLGVGEEVLRYVWDNDDTAWIQQLGSSNILTDAEIKVQYENNANTNAFTDTEKGKIVTHETLIDINAQAIANLATAQGIVTGIQTAGYVYEPMPAVWTQMVFDTTTPSTDSDVFEIDDVANTITFKTNASFNCNNAIAVEAVTPSEITLQCRIVNVADDSVVVTRDAIIQTANGTISYLDVLELLTIGKNGMPSAPVTLRMEVREATASYNMVSFRSVITSSSSYDVSTSHDGLSGREVADSHPMSAITGLLTNLPEPVFPADEGLPLVAKSTGAVYEEILGLPDETDNTGKSVTNLGTKKSSFWSVVNCNPNVMDEDQVIPDGVSASVVDGFTIADGFTLTVPDGSVLSVV